jgi:methyl-accepting chemotaxis protein
VIAQVASEQASGLVQVGLTVSEMDRMTQHDAAMVEESTAAARSPAGEAACMADLVAHFRTSAEQVERDRNAVVRMAA